ncbi:leucine-rich repeat protein [Aminipila butyrica]|uniref:Leucine-rich repeat protein n=1 Tax=Aminipila butyrica TaxID=433296 RepID=A0A858BX07_9FIRM|nr:leucine-rich repeat protein [Aminipila butyrica]QIB69709.1 leucine-rich repeat protein [Aminipila butyrica]
MKRKQLIAAMIISALSVNSISVVSAADVDSTDATQANAIESNENVGDSESNANDEAISETVDGEDKGDDLESTETQDVTDSGDETNGIDDGNNETDDQGTQPEAVDSQEKEENITEDEAANDEIIQDEIIQEKPVLEDPEILIEPEINAPLMQAIMALQLSVGTTFEKESITYKVLSEEDKTVQVGTGSEALSGLSGSITIPATIEYEGETYTVTTIGNKAFMRNEEVTSVTLPSTITTLGDMAFYSVTMTSLSLPDSVRTLGVSCFAGSSLESITLPDGIEEIPEQAFSLCEQLTSVELPASLTTIQKDAFNSCGALTDITIPAKVTDIGEKAFWSNGSLKTVTFENNSELESIGKQAFHFCEQLESINIPSSIVRIENSAFQNCAVLKTMGLETADSNLEYLGESAFSSTQIKNIYIPASTTSIGKDALHECKKLKSITVSGDNADYSSTDGILFNKAKTQLIAYPASKDDEKYITPESVQTIDAYAFASAANLEEITLTDNVTAVGMFAFSNASSLKKVTFGKNVETIGRLAFQNCTKLKTVILSEKLTSVPDYLFYKCTALTSLTIPASVTYIDDNILSGCENLESVTMLSMELDFDASAFNSVPSTTQYTVETDAIKGVMVSTLGISGDKITSKGHDPIPEIDNFVTDGIYYKVLTDPKGEQNGTVQVGNGSFGGFTLTANMTIPEEVIESLTGQKYTVTSIGASAFADALGEGSNLKTIAIPKSVVTIQDKAFSDCSSLTTVTFEEGSQLQSIGADAFGYCTSLLAIQLPSTVKTIGNNAFKNCKYLKTVTFGSSLESIGDSAFATTKVSVVELPATIKSIGTQAFYDCNSLTSIQVAAGSSTYSSVDGVLMNAAKMILLQYPAAKEGNSYSVPDTVKTITDYAFYKNQELKTLALGTDVTTIGTNAMNQMAKLTAVTMHDDVTAIGKMAFYKCVNLESVKLSARLTSLADYLFYSCDALEEIEIPKSVVSFGASALPGNLTTIKIRSTATTSETIELGAAFNSLKSAQYYVATEAVKSKLVEKGVSESNITVDNTLLEDDIKEAAFTKDGISYVVLADPDNGENGTIQVGNGSTLTGIAGDVVIPSQVIHNGYRYTVKTIATSAFHGNADITSITIPNTIEKIGVNAISSNANLTSVIFAEGSTLKELENGAISDNAKLEVLTLPASLETVHDYVFAWNYGLKTVTFEEGSQLTHIGKGMFFRGRLLEEITLPTTITEIGEEAFYNCESLTAIKVQGDETTGFVANLKNVDTIGASAFYGCAKIEKVILSDGLTELENGAFYGCSALNEVIFGNGILSLGATLTTDAEEDFKGIFEGCVALEKIVLPESVTYIGKNTFFDCTALKKIVIQSAALSKLGTNAFYGISTDAVFVVQKNAVKAELVASGKIKGEKVIALETLESLITTAESSSASQYTEENYANLQEKLSKAKATLENAEEITVAEFNTVVNELTTAISNKKTSGGSSGSKSSKSKTDTTKKETTAPSVKGSDGSKVSISNDGKSAKIVAEKGYVVTDVLVNGVSVGPVEELENLKPTDEIAIVVETVKASTGDFNDIKEHWAHDAISNAIEKGLIQGVTKTEFAPNKTLTREEAIRILYVLYGEKTEGNGAENLFQDVSSDNAYKDAIAWASQNGIVSGTGDNNLSPEKDITREEMIALIYRCNVLKGYDTSSRSDVNQFSDRDEISSYAYENLSWAVSKGLLQGKSADTLAPKAGMTRAEAASIAVRVEALN